MGLVARRKGDRQGSVSKGFLEEGRQSGRDFWRVGGWEAKLEGAD